MNETIIATIITAVLSLVGTLSGSFFAAKKSNDIIAYRLQQLEDKVNKHNTVIERTYILEEQMKVANHRISDLEEKEK